MTIANSIINGMERKELSIFTRIDSFFSFNIQINLTGHKKSLTFYIVVQKIGI